MIRSFLVSGLIRQCPLSLGLKNLISHFVGLLKRRVEMLEALPKFIGQRLLFTASEVYPGLFQSSKIRTEEDSEFVEDLGVKLVVDLEGGFDPVMNFLDTYLFWPIHDLPILPDVDLLVMVCSFIYRQLELGGKVLVHCSQGLNRSGLVCGRVMVMKGMTGVEAIRQIRFKRPGSLWNRVFSKYLESFH